MFSELRKVTGDFVIFVCSSTWNSLDPTGWIFMKYDIWVFIKNMSWKFKFHHNLIRIMGTLHEYFGPWHATDDNITGCICFAFWITEATNTHLEYIIRTGNSCFAHTPQYYIYTYIACLVLHIKLLHTYTL